MSSSVCSSVNHPFLPRNSFSEITKNNFKKVQGFDYINGYRIPRIVTNALENVPPQYTRISKIYNPALSFGSSSRKTQPFDPPDCLLDNKILRFYGFIKQATHESQDEIYRVRPLTIHYYLQDDTIMVMEKRVPNSGMEHGRLFRRQRMPKNDTGDYYRWKDLTVGINVEFYGHVIRIVDCDKWTAEFLASEGIELGQVEAIPPDPYTEKRISDHPPLYNIVTPSTDDKKSKFLKYDGLVLRFYCVWDDRQSVYGTLKPYIILYYLGDDTVEVHEIHTPNDGRDPVPWLIRRQKIVKNYKSPRSDIPSIIMEPTDKDVEFYSPKDFGVGKTVEILGRQFLIYDCDQFTKDFYFQNYGITDFTPIEIKTPEQPNVPKIIPTYKGWGTSAPSTYQKCITSIPVPPQKNFVWQLEHAGVVFRYLAQLETVQENDLNRRFIISVHISQRMISVYEITIDGFLGGPFLSKRVVPKPGCDENNPVYYTYQDFEVGNVIDVFGHRFLLVNEDKFISQYKENHPESFAAPKPSKNKNEYLPVTPDCEQNDKNDILTCVPKNSAKGVFLR